MTQTEKSGHLAWCALVALALARKDGSVCSPAQENLFLTRWLAIALKQRRFPRDVALDIEWLLKQGRQLGVRAKLAEKLNYLWRSCVGELSEQNDLFRLTYCLETAKDLRWNYRLLSDREWSGRYAVALHAEDNAIHLSQSNLDVAFDDDGWQIRPLRFCRKNKGKVILSRYGSRLRLENAQLQRSSLSQRSHIDGHTVEARLSA
ncbi:DUF2913 family protein [Yersinia ruckeri]|uniref:DUF2913 family protein n=1 Tax=Yersinia ruckeri TaxID=29486 RepID=UPI001F302222|nr:DUF2913 family protein [Yersinia ruckeri]UIN02546.1 DUF2913 family protein [Yersinia ruckeri]